LLRRPKENRQNKTKRPFDTARILIMEEALRERKAKEQQRMDEKERMAALRALVGFAKDRPGGF
jgi:hypothetical protein